MTKGGYKLALLFTLVLATVSCASANDLLKKTEHTYHLQEGAKRPHASIEDATMLAGFWHGEAFGEKFEETWNMPSGGSMVGLFKLLDDEGVNFYEILVIDEEDDSLVMKVKHFSADFVAWETKEDHVRFPLVHLEADALHFSGLSFYKQKNGDLIGYLAMRRNGELVEEKLTFRRQ